jgi:phage terminase large subunit GpA-like protein
MNIADAWTEITRAVAEAVLPDPELHLDAWSEEHVVLPKGSAFAGPYRLSHTPYARKVLQCLSPGHPAARVVVMAASQMLKTQIFINAALGWIDRAPANILALEPTDKLAKRLSSRAAKAIEACDVVASKVAKPRSRDSRNTVDCKEFDGGALYITTAGSASNLAEIPARYFFCDEVDRVEVIAAEGHPVEIGEARLTTYEGISKAYHVSSPLLLGSSKIHELYDLGTRETYHVPCPHCGHLHELVQDNFKYDYDSETDRVHRAWFVCPDCGAEIDEHHKATMLPDEALGGQARWVAGGTGDGETVSFHISAFYAPLGSISWLKLARQHARAVIRKKRGDPSGEQTYWNTRLGLCYDPSDTTTTAQQLQERAEAYPPRVVPDQALVLTAYADTQVTRLEVVIEAWGPGLESWIIDHIVLWGSPSEPPETPGSVWQRLDEIRRTPLAHASGTPIMISAYGIDTGGANTQDVYNYAYEAERFSCLATKGASQRNRPIIAGAPSKQDVDWQGKKVPEGLKLWSIGTDTAKDHIFNRLGLTHGPGAMHFHNKLDAEFYEQLLAERPQTRWHKGRAIREYIKPNGARNEVLDCVVGNLAVAYHLGLHKWAANDWRRLREKLVPQGATPDLFATVDLQDAQAAAVATAPTSAAQPPASTPVQTPAPSAPAPLPPVNPPAAPAGRRVLSRGIQ